ncbi:phage portal protein, partial [Candidatus Magnetobacterium casense]
TFATAQQDKLNWYDDTIIPECELIQEVLNEQLIKPLGYMFEFEPQSLTIYQEDEEQRAAAFKLYVDAGIRPSIVGETLGIELPENVTYAALDEKFDQGIDLANQLAEQANQPKPDEEEPEKDEDEEEDEEEKAYRTDLQKWERRVMKRVEAGKAILDRPFESDYIPAVVVGAIEGALEVTTIAEGIEAIFADAMSWAGYP